MKFLKKNSLVDIKPKIIKISLYIIRFLLALVFIPSAIGTMVNPTVPGIESGVSEDFIVFYEILVKTGYIHFVVFFQIICGLLMVFKRTYLLGGVMFVPLLLCLLNTHIFISKSSFYLIFDAILLLLTTVVIISRARPLMKVFLKKQSGWV